MVLVGFKPISMSVDHRGDAGDKSPRIWSRGTLMQIVPQILSGYKISSTRLLALSIDAVTILLYTSISFLTVVSHCIYLLSTYVVNTRIY